MESRGRAAGDGSEVQLAAKLMGAAGGYGLSAQLAGPAFQLAAVPAFHDIVDTERRNRRKGGKGEREDGRKWDGRDWKEWKEMEIIG